MSTTELTDWETEPLLEGYDPLSKESEFQVAPAKWIWIPGERTLPCTFVLFRKEFELENVPKIARGWIAADSRYVLYVNGIRVQFGPAPHDPRHAEADPIDIGPYLRAGSNVIGVHVLFYGQGDGTWPTGKPGLLFRLSVGKQIIASDDTWLCCIDRGHPPGGAKRWYLRALQEKFVAQRFPYDWNLVGYEPDVNWHKAVELKMSASSSAISGPHGAYNEDIRMVDPSRSTIRPRSIPMLSEEITRAIPISAQRITWHGPIDDWFENRVPGLFTVGPVEDTANLDFGSWLVTYELPFTMVGWPIVQFKNSPPDCGVMEVMVQESLDPDHPLMDTQFFAWSRIEFSSQEKQYELFDYECCRFIQLHFFVPEGCKIELPVVKFRRRTLIVSSESNLKSSDPQLESLFFASMITLANSAQDIVVDGMARERQQYGGDGAHQLHAVRQAHGIPSLSARYLRQFAHGQMLNGVWFDSWPAYDRYARLAQRQIGLSEWGSLVDHSIGFVMEHVHHWLQTGDRTPFEENQDKIQRFVDYLSTITGLDGLLKVDDIGAEAVWMDHDAYREQGHKKLAFNLYALQMLAMLDWIQGSETDLSFPLDRIRSQFWHPIFAAMINNRSDVATRSARFCDRSIAHLLWLQAYGYDAVPDLAKTIELLSSTPKSMGLGYPANSIWRHWAWARIGRVDLILKEFRDRWASMFSVKSNRTIQETWTAKPGTKAQLSHCAVAPTIVAHQVLLGIGQDRDANWFVRPQLDDLESFEITSYTPWGRLSFSATLQDGFHRCHLVKPSEMPLTVRTVVPIDLPFQDRGHEYVSNVSSSEVVMFDVYPYPKNQLIYDVVGQRQNQNQG